jgi:hypothetical protein
MITLHARLRRRSGKITAKSIRSGDGVCSN